MKKKATFKNAKKVFATSALILSFVTSFSQTEDNTSNQSDNPKDAACNYLNNVANGMTKGTDGERPICKEFENPISRDACDQILDWFAKPFKAAVDKECGGRKDDE